MAKVFNRFNASNGLSVKQYTEMILNGTTNPTGGESPYRVDKGILNDLIDAGSTGLELELTKVTGVGGGLFFPDGTPLGTPGIVIGSYNCQLKLGTSTTFANLGAADAVCFMLNAGKCLVKAIQPMKDGIPVVSSRDGSPVYNIVPVNGIVFSRTNEKHIAALNAIVALSEKVEAAIPAGG